MRSGTPGKCVSDLNCTSITSPADSLGPYGPIVQDIRPNDVVLELSWSLPDPDAKKQTAYVGWIGGSSAGATLPPLLKSEAAAGPAVNHQIIELDSFFGRGLGLQDGQKAGYVSQRREKEHTI